VLGGLRVLWLENTESLLRAFGSTQSFPSPPIFRNLAFLDVRDLVSTSDSSAASITRGNLPALRSLTIGLASSSTWPFHLAAAPPPPLLTRLLVTSGAPPSLTTLDPLLISNRCLAALAPTLESLSVDKARATDPHMSLALCPWHRTSALTHLRVPVDATFTERSRAVAARSTFAPLAPSLRRLELVKSWRSGDRDAAEVTLPPALSLLTELTCLEVRVVDLVSAGPLRCLTELRRLVVQTFDHYFSSTSRPRHAPVRSEDLCLLTKLKFLHLSHSAECYVPVLRAGLPSLTHIVLGDYSNPRIAMTVLGRVMGNTTNRQTVMAFEEGGDDAEPHRVDADWLGQKCGLTTTTI
jgi:hypothetical protein